jgi:hypothetical protein
MGHYRTLIADPAEQIRGLRRRLSALERRVRQVPATPANGSFTLVWRSNNGAVSGQVYHGLGVTPAVILLTPNYTVGNNDNAPVLGVYARNATWFQVVGVMASNKTRTISIRVDWLAIA